MDLFEGVKVDTGGKSRHELLMELPLDERLQRRIVDGEKNGLEADLDDAMAAGRTPLAIVNDTLLSGMKVVGELFGSGEMQLPFVLQSAEVAAGCVVVAVPGVPGVAFADGPRRLVVASLAHLKPDDLCRLSARRQGLTPLLRAPGGCPPAKTQAPVLRRCRGSRRPGSRPARAQAYRPLQQRKARVRSPEVP